MLQKNNIKIGIFFFIFLFSINASGNNITYSGSDSLCFTDLKRVTQCLTNNQVFNYSSNQDYLITLRYIEYEPNVKNLFTHGITFNQLIVLGFVICFFVFIGYFLNIIL